MHDYGMLAGSKIWGVCFGVSVPLVLCQLYDLHH